MPETNVPRTDVPATDVPVVPGVPETTNTAQVTRDSDALLSRLRLIEDQPLEQRAAAFAQVHDELQAALEGGDSTRSHG